MLRACLTQSKSTFNYFLEAPLFRTVAGSKSVASTSALRSAPLHTSAILQAEHSRKSTARAVRKSNNVKKEERWRKANATRPSFVLGTRPGDDAKWESCDLNKILIDEEALASGVELLPTEQPVGTVYLPKELGFGVGEAEKKMLFQDLPILSAEASIQGSSFHTNAVFENEHSEGIARELHKANSFAKLLDLRNANASGLAFENRRRIIAAFSGPENPFDSGRSEVQGAQGNHAMSTCSKPLAM